jgi:hypothetical protein
MSAVELDPTPEQEVGGEEQGPQEVPSIFSVTTRFVVGRVDVSPPAADGSRVVRMFSGNGSTVIEANFSPEICEFVADKLVEVEVITQDDAEEVPDAGHGED